jgi:predicted GIY-YIG superfamily endonuclease
MLGKINNYLLKTIEVMLRFVKSVQSEKHAMRLEME